MGFITTTVQGNVAVITIAKEPVNSMDLNLWIELQDTYRAAKKDPKIRGIIFESGIQRPIFTAGNDLMELYAPKTSPERYEKFWTISNQLLAEISVSPMVTVCIVNGNCPAGGCCLALTCDYRIASQDAVMGLNEPMLGIPVPEYWAKLLCTVVGQGKADKMIQFGQMIPAKDALRIGLVDQLVESRGELRGAAIASISKLLMIPDLGRQIGKSALRGELAKAWSDQKRLHEESSNGFKMLSLPGTVKSLDGVFTRLGGGKSKL